MEIELGSQDSGPESWELQYNGTISSGHPLNLIEHFKTSIAYTFFTIVLKTGLHWIGKWKMKWSNLRECLNIYGANVLFVYWFLVCLKK